MAKDEKQAALDAALKKIEKNFGKDKFQHPKT